MANRPKSRQRSDEPFTLPTAVKVLGVVLIIAAIWGLSWLISIMGPRPVPYSDAAYGPVGELPKEVTVLIDQSRALERSFKDAEANGQIKDDDLKNLAEAIRLQEDYLVKSGGRDSTASRQRLTSMNTALEFHQSEPVRKQSDDLEQKAMDLEDKKDYAGAIDLLDKAATLQEKINTEYSLSKLSSFSRTAYLRRHIEYLKALPIYEQSVAAEEDAKAAIAREDWKAAHDDYQKAYDLQKQLNNEYADQRFASVSRQKSLDSERSSLESTNDHLRITKTRDDAQVADAAGDYTHAADLFQQAIRMQRELIAAFPNSRFAKDPLVESLDSEYQTSNSHRVADEIKSQTANVAASLRARQWQQARDVLAVVSQKAEHFHENFPRSTLLDDDIIQQLQFLNFKRQDLGKIQDEVYAQMLPLPGHKNWTLYKSEVPQSLYMDVIGGNPSRHAGPNLPVDSVNWNEANDFTRHLQWILARPVRLPTAEEFRAAVGPTDAINALDTAWNLDNSENNTHPVASKQPNAAGFYDLLGNVAEWLDHDSSMLDNQSPVAGGNAQTAVDSIPEAKITNIPLNDRNRFTGFRFVIDMDESAPLISAKSMPSSVAAPASSSPPSDSAAATGK